MVSSWWWWGGEGGSASKGRCSRVRCCGMLLIVVFVGSAASAALKCVPLKADAGSLLLDQRFDRFGSGLMASAETPRQFRASKTINAQGGDHLEEVPSSVRVFVSKRTRTVTLVLEP